MERSVATPWTDWPSVSGIYPHLAVTNESDECGIGAVVPWAGRLWFLTYPPHRPEGSDDKLYWLDEGLREHVHPASVGGTHACRMIHPESGQLVIGPYFIDRAGTVRAIAPERMPARLTSVARHLTNPAELLYYVGMEGELYEVDARTLEVRRLYGIGETGVPGTHAKGGRTGQGRLIVTNNGDRGWSAGRESGALAEWNGSDWSLLARTPFTEVAGPDGLLGGVDTDAPVWTLGWDECSVLLRLLDGGRWLTYRLPKGSFTHDALHGWYTEWPRIRDVGAEKLLMHMHGLFWEFPRTFRAADTSGLRPLSTYHKMPVDYCEWNGRIAMAANDASRFENPFVERADSNLWFGTLEDLRGFGSPGGWGGVWHEADLAAGQASDPFLVAGFTRRVLHIAVGGGAASFALELDSTGRGSWQHWRQVDVEAGGYAYVLLPEDLTAEWLRLVPPRAARGVSASLHLSNPYRGRAPRGSRPVALSLDGLADAGDVGANEGLLLPGDGPGRELWYRPDGAPEGQVVDVDSTLTLMPRHEARAAAKVERVAALGAPVFTLDEASVVVTTPEGERLRLPRTDPAYDQPFASGWPRSEREVVTERSLLNIHGTFYELPRPSSGGLRRIRPICTHGKRVTDFCSWHGMLVLAGTRADAPPDGHLFRATEGEAALWFGNVDDLWGFGKPVGHGGPWAETPVAAGVPSDAYLMTGYDRKRLSLRHDSPEAVTFTVEVDFDQGGWHRYGAFAVPPGETVRHAFPTGYAAHWVRVTADRRCSATARLVYE